MENHRTLIQRLAKLPVLAVLVCGLAAVAFAHIALVGFDSGFASTFYGWPAPFAEYRETCHYNYEVWSRAGENEPLEDVTPSRCTYFRMDSVASCILDNVLALLLIASAGVGVLRFQQRTGRRWQFSIADLFSLITTTSMVLGLVCLDSRLSLGENSMVKGMYVRICDLPLFDRVMTLFAIACAVWLIVSTAIDRLGGKNAKQ